MSALTHAADRLLVACDTYRADDEHRNRVLREAEVAAQVATAEALTRIADRLDLGVQVLR